MRVFVAALLALLLAVAAPLASAQVTVDFGTTIDANGDATTLDINNNGVSGWDLATTAGVVDAFEILTSGGASTDIEVTNIAFIDDLELRVTFAAAGGIGTAVPSGLQIAYTANGVFNFVNGSPVASFTVDSTSWRDRAAPRLQSSRLIGDVAHFKFTEPLRRKSDDGTVFNNTDFTYTDVDMQDVDSAVAGANTDLGVSISINFSNVPIQDNTDTIVFAANRFEDLGSSLLGTPEITRTLDDDLQATDGDTELVSATTNDDTASNGFTSGLILEFSRPLLDSTISGSALTDGLSVTVGGTPVPLNDDPDTGLFADDRFVSVTFTTEVEGTGLPFSAVLTSSGATASDFAGGNLGGGATTPTDGTRPVLMRAESEAGLNTITLTYSEVVTNASAEAASYTVADYAPGAVAVSSVTATGTETVVLNLDTTLVSVPDGVLDVTVTGAAVDAAGNSGAASATIAVDNSDDTAPQASNATTGDSLGSGTVDRIVVAFDEPLGGSTSAGDWTVTGYTVDNATISGNEVTLELSGGAAGTAAVPAVSYSGTTLQDLNDNDFAGVVPATTDGAGPVLVSATSSFDSTDITATFSEAIAASTDENAFTFKSVTPTGAGTPAGATIVVNVAALNTTDFASPAEALTATGVTDGAGNAATSSVDLSPADASMPTFVGAATRDDNDDGTLDAVVITFSRDVTGPASADGVIAIGGHTVGAASYSGSTMTVAVTPTVAGPNTGATPSVNTAGAGVTSLEAVAVATISGTAVDEAAPVLLTVTGDVGVPDLTFTFSESVSGVPEALSSFLVWNGVGSATTLTTTDDNTEEVYGETLFDMEKSFFTSGDFFSVNGSAGVDDGAAGNAVSTTATALLTFEDTTAPVVVATPAFSDEAGGTDGVPNGFVDTVTVSFSKDLDADSVASSAAGEWAYACDGHVYTVTGVAAGASADEVVLNVTERISGDLANADTGATNCELNYTAGSITDLNTNPLASFDSQAVEDGAAAVILLAEGTVTGTSLELTLSEGFAALVAGDFALGGTIDTPHDIGSVTYTADERSITLNLNGGSFTVGVFNGTSTVAFSGPPADGNGVDASTATRVVTDSDAAGPAFEEASTVDSNGDGAVDQLLVQFDEDVSSGVGTAASDWSVAGYTTTGTLAAGPSGTQLLVSLSRDAGGFDTDADDLLVSYSGGGIEDDSGNAAQNFTNQAVDDGAAPAIVDVVGTVGSANVEVVFSEEPRRAGSPESTDFSGVFTFDTDGARTVSSATRTPGSATVAVALSSALDQAAFDDGDGIMLADSVVQDLAANVAAAATVAVRSDNPTVTSVTTGSSPGGTVIDSLVVEFSRAMDPTTVVAAASGFTLPGGGTVGAVVSLSAVRYSIAVSGVGGGTEAVPDLSYDEAAGAADPEGVLLLSFTARNGTVDGAAPVLVSALFNTGSNVLQFTFSEPVFGPGGSPVLDVDLTYADVGGAGATAFDSFASATTDGRDGTMTVNMNSDFVRADEGSDSVTVVNLVDGTGNAVSAESYDLGFLDTTRPEISSAETRDGNGDGTVEEIVVVMSKALDPTSVSAADFDISEGTITGVELQNGDTEVVLTVSGLGQNTAVTPSVSVAGVIEDRNGNTADDDAEPVVADDGAAPAMIIITGTVGESAITVLFSEGSSDAVETGDFTLVGSDISIDSVGGGGDVSGGQVTLELSRPLTLDDLSGGTTTLTIAAGVVSDGEGSSNGEVTVAVDNSVTESSSMTGAETVDGDGDGRLDHVRVTFTADIVDSTVSLTDFEVEGYTVSAADSSVVTDAAGDATLYLGIAPAAALGTDVGDTAAEPNVTLVSGATTRDIHGFSVNAASVVAADRAEPAVVTAYAGVGTTKMVVFLSEALDTSLSGDVGANSFDYLDANPGVASARGIAAVESSEGLQFTLITRGDVVETDTGASGDLIGLSIDRSVDVNGNRVTVVRRTTVSSSTDLASSSSTDDTSTVAVAVGGGAAFLGIMLLVVLCVVKKKKDDGKSDLEMHADSRAEELTNDGAMKPYTAPGAGATAASATEGDMHGSSSSDALVAGSRDRVGTTEEVVVEVGTASAAIDESVSVPPPAGDPPSGGESD